MNLNEMTLRQLADKYGFDNLNTFTKYPSIQTYHEIDRGILKPNLTDTAFPEGKQLYITEKVDGTNGRIVIFNGEWLIGGREEFLGYSGDWLYNHNLHVVDVMRPVADKIASQLPHDGKLYTFYGEVYGYNITHGKMYTRSNTLGLRFFDVVVMEDLSIMEQPIEKLSSWREHGGQNYLSVSDMKKLILSLGFSEKNIVPYVKIINSNELPAVLDATYEWLKQFEKSVAVLDENYFEDKRPGGKAEGVVVRLEDRSLIRKIRFEDYEKTFRAKK